MEVKHDWSDEKMERYFLLAFEEILKKREFKPKQFSKKKQEALKKLKMKAGLMTTP